MVQSDANISKLPLSVLKEFEIISASDPRACLIVSSDGIVLAMNLPVKHSVPDFQTGTNIKSRCADPEQLQIYLNLCARTRGPLPGKIALKLPSGQITDWNCHGGLAAQTEDGQPLIILRLQLAELGKSAFEKLNQQIRALNAELGWRTRADHASSHLAAIVSSSTDAIYSKDLDKIVLSWNSGAEILFGFSADEMVGSPILVIVPEDKRDEEESILKELRSGTLGTPVETVRQTKNGEMIDVSITSSPLKDRDGAVIGYSKIVRDISARKQIERSLRSANTTFSHLINNSPFGIYSVDADFRLAQVSAGAQKAFENVRPLIGRDFSEAMRILWPEPSATDFIKKFRHTLDTGDAYREPTLVQTRHDTSEMEAYDWKIERMTLPDGRLGVVCHFYDLSERQRYEEALRKSEEKFRGTFENTSVGIAHVNLDADWLEFNDQFCELLGYSRDELSKLSLSSVRHSDDQKASEKRVHQLLSGKVTHIQCEERYIRKDGSIIWLGISGDMQKGSNEDQPYLIYVLRDISERKMAEDHQEFLMHELAHRTKNQLAVVIAIARQTAKSAETVKDFKKVFEQRLHGLGLSLNLLVKRGWSGAPLKQLIDVQLEVFKGDDSRLVCDGPDVALDSVAAETLGLALHELSTNCLKYGAWSVPSGIVSIKWNFVNDDPDSAMRLCWVERDGPVVKPPSRAGFGQTVIEKLVAQKLNAEVSVAYPGEGFTWTLLIPNNHIGEI